jgi:hypothetical protein
MPDDTERYGRVSRHEASENGTSALLRCARTLVVLSLREQATASDCRGDRVVLVAGQLKRDGLGSSARHTMFFRASPCQPLM